MSYREPRAPYFWALIALSFVALVWLDQHVAFVYVSRWVLAVPILVLLFPTRVDGSYWIRAAAVVGLCLTPYALGPVRWNTLKSFYSDCATIRSGSALSEAQRQMAHYHLQSAIAGKPDASDPLMRPHLTYHPTLDHSADWCVITTNGPQVVGVFIYPD
ncbi:MAG: hypothetical protein M5U32_02380 [Myxococcota bacterium]|nr:hypothetical protein [Myxococcota bacterium]